MKKSTFLLLSGCCFFLTSCLLWCPKYREGQTYRDPEDMPAPMETVAPQQNSHSVNQ